MLEHEPAAGPGELALAVHRAHRSHPSRYRDRDLLTRRQDEGLGRGFGGVREIRKFRGSPSRSRTRGGRCDSLLVLNGDLAFGDSDYDLLAALFHSECGADGSNERVVRLDYERAVRILCHSKQRCAVIQEHTALSVRESHAQSRLGSHLKDATVSKRDLATFASLRLDRLPAQPLTKQCRGRHHGHDGRGGHERHSPASWGGSCLPRNLGPSPRPQRNHRIVDCVGGRRFRADAQVAPAPKVGQRIVHLRGAQHLGDVHRRFA